jgi:hypothetical protein
MLALVKVCPAIPLRLHAGVSSIFQPRFCSGLLFCPHRFGLKSPTPKHLPSPKEGPGGEYRRSNTLTSHVTLHGFALTGGLIEDMKLAVLP